MPGGVSYEFHYTTDGNGKITKTTVTEPDDTIRETTFGSSRRVVAEEIRRCLKRDIARELFRTLTAAT